VPEIVKWLDYAYGPEGHMLFNFGVEGLSYNMVNGFPQYTDLVMKNPQGLPLAQSMAQHFRSNFAGPFIQDARYFTQYANLPEQQDSIKVWGVPTSEKLLPPITPTQEESKKNASIMNDVNTFMNEAMLKIVTGQQPVSSWDDVVKQLKAMGIEDAVKVQQAALDRYNARK
jgi:putative aldouronate transport system substrate-binding protein